MTQSGTSFLCTAQDEAQAGLIAGILENAGIPYIIRHQGAGPIYGSASIFGVELHVPTPSFAQAKEILEAYVSRPEETDDQDLY